MNLWSGCAIYSSPSEEGKRRQVTLGILATINGKMHGITVAHVFESVGDEVFTLIGENFVLVGKVSKMCDDIDICLIELF